MDGTEQIDREGEMLKRIIALLLSLAGLTERSVHRSYPLRCFLLWIFRRAEAVIQHWLHEPLPGCGHAPSFWNAGSPAEALRLAEVFRAAARLLQAEERERQYMADWWALPSAALEDIISADWDACENASCAPEGALTARLSRVLRHKLQTALGAFDLAPVRAIAPP